MVGKDRVVTSTDPRLGIQGIEREGKGNKKHPER